MDTQEQIKKFEDFFDAYSSKIADKLRRGRLHLVVKFKDLAEFSPELADLLLENPSDTLAAAELAMKGKHEVPKFFIRIVGLPHDLQYRIRDLRSQHLGKFINLKGYVQAKSDVRPKITAAKFECPNCGAIINILQQEPILKEPTKCGCGRKGHFKLISESLVDGFSLVLEEAPEVVKHGTETKSINVFVKDDLTDVQIEDKIFQGSKLSVNGCLKSLFKTKEKSKMAELDIYLEANYIEFLETTFADVKVTQDETNEIIKLAARKDVLDILTRSVFGAFYGHKDVKEAIILQAFGGVWREECSLPMRGAIHILLIGDPGSGKSSLLKIGQHFLPKCRYSAGSGMSGCGLTAAVVRDELLGGYRVAAGALPLANEGVALLDELDKAKPEDLQSMHEALEQGTVSISKANIHKTLVSKTSVLAAANPKWGRFDPSESIYTQTTFEPTLINRFDLIFPFKDERDEVKDYNTAMRILYIEEEEGEKVSFDLIKKYIAYAKRINPLIPKQLSKMIAERYVKIRTKKEDNSKSFPISARQVGGIKRLTEAHARMKLREVPIIEDVNFAINAVEQNLYTIAFDKETGTLDIDKIETGISSSRRNLYEEIDKSIRGLESQFPTKCIPNDSLFKILGEKFKIYDIESALDKMKREGLLYEPKPGFVRLLV